MQQKQSQSSGSGSGSGSGPSTSTRGRPRGSRRSRRRSSASPPPPVRFYNISRPEPFQLHDLQTRVTPVIDFDKAYFDSYAHLGVHEEMIKDRVRIDAYKAAITQYQSFIAGKVVLDVGCGTGILSIFCAQAGAKRVYAVEASNIAAQARRVVEANNLSNVIIVLQGRVEDVQLDENVDVLISEWMGYMLLYESMLESVIIARDRWLRPGGLILPSDATLYMAPVTNTNRYRESVDFWRDVYGIDMSALLPLAKQCAFEEPNVETITGENVLARPHVVKHVSSYFVTIPELESVSTRFQFKSLLKAPLHGFAFWFDVVFNEPILAPMPISYQLPTSPVDTNLEDGSQRKRRTSPNDAPVLSTAPKDPPTHWQQTLVYLYDPIELEHDQLIEGSVTLSQSRENARVMNIHLEYGSGGQLYVKKTVMK